MSVCTSYRDDGMLSAWLITEMVDWTVQTNGAVCTKESIVHSFNFIRVNHKI